MSGNKILDTNILIYLSKQTLSLKDVISPDELAFISIITYMEAMGYPFKDKNEEALIHDLCKTIPIINLTDDIVEEVLRIRKKKKIKLPDVIIFASAKVNALSLVTVNKRDFKGLNGNVKVINPLKA
ncbi:MAG: PIN domain-containing protein [Bacteroidetes bacterium]|nr:MAG: PIN domain-containing protein [Bacteroidota bacterium]